VCFAYEKKRGFLRVVKDGEVMGVNGPDEEMTGVVIPEDFLSKVTVHA